MRRINTCRDAGTEACERCTWACKSEMSEEHAEIMGRNEHYDPSPEARIRALERGRERDRQERDTALRELAEAQAARAAKDNALKYLLADHEVGSHLPKGVDCKCRLCVRARAALSPTAGADLLAECAAMRGALEAARATDEHRASCILCPTHYEICGKALDEKAVQLRDAALASDAGAALLAKVERLEAIEKVAIDWREARRKCGISSGRFDIEAAEDALFTALEATSCQTE